MDWNDMKDKFDLDPEAQEKIASLAPGLFLASAILLATFLRGKKIPVRETASEVGAQGKRAVSALAARVPFLPKPKTESNGDASDSME